VTAERIPLGPAPFNISKKWSAANLTGACPVQYFEEMERSEFNWGGFNRGEAYLTGTQPLCFSGCPFFRFFVLSKLIISLYFQA
jgi:hypothetical protein